MRHSSLVLGLCALGFGCSARTEGTAQKQEGLVLTTQEDGRVAGSYSAGGVKISFESAIVDGTKYLRIISATGEELVTSEITGDKYVMSHKGVSLNMAVSADDQPAAKAFIESEEAQLVASLWRELTDTPLMNLAAIKPLYEYGVHVDEVIGLKTKEASGERDHCTGGCYGQCGPSCFSWGTNTYCKNHDCCCRHYGSGACYTWCFVNPSCPHPGTC